MTAIAFKLNFISQIQDENEKLKSQNKTLQTNLEQLQGLREVWFFLLYVIIVADESLIK